jgi:hypothetical protein
MRFWKASLSLALIPVLMVLVYTNVVTTDDALWWLAGWCLVDYAWVVVRKVKEHG